MQSLIHNLSNFGSHNSPPPVLLASFPNGKKKFENFLKQQAIVGKEKHTHQLTLRILNSKHEDTNINIIEGSF